MGELTLDSGLGGFAFPVDRDFLLLVGGPTSVRLNFVASGPTIAQRLGVRVRFCDRAGCADEPDPVQIDYVFERPFLLGRRTTHTIMIDGIPTESRREPVLRCQVGCSHVATSGMPTSFCDDADVHVCE